MRIFAREGWREEGRCMYMGRRLPPAHTPASHSTARRSAARSLGGGTLCARFSRAQHMHPRGVVQWGPAPCRALESYMHGSAARSVSNKG